MDQVVLSANHDGVLIVTLNRPEKLNALNPPLSYGLRDVLRSAARDPAVRVVVLTGAGRSFCSGGDVTAFGTIDPTDPVAVRSQDRADWNDLELSADRLRERSESPFLLHTMPKPTIAMVRGAAAGAGLSLAAACDFRVASETAVFSSAFAKVGVSGDYGGSYFLTRLIGSARTRELYFLGGAIAAPEALRLGMVTRTVPDDALEDETMSLARRLAEGPPVAYRCMKQNINAAETERLADLLDIESRNMVRTLATTDSREAIGAFLEKRPVAFVGS